MNRFLQFYQCGRIDEAAPALAGNWQSTCTSATALEYAKMRKTYSFNVIGDFSSKTEFFVGETCENPELVYHLRGTYAELGDAETTADAKKLNLTVRDAKVTPNVEAAVQKLNEMDFCEKSDWRAGEEVDITGMNCEPLSVKRGDVALTIYEKRDDNMYFGEADLPGFFKPWESDRPDSLNTDIVYSRQ